MLEQLRAQIRAKLDERSNAKAAVDAALTDAKAENRDLTDAEHTAFTEARDRVVAIDAEVDQLDARVKELEAAEAADQAANRRAQEYGGARPTQVRVTSEPDIYRPHGQHSFIRDAYSVQLNAGANPDAFDRIQRHQRATAHLLEARAAEAGVESRDVGTSAFGDGLVVPQFLVDEYAANAREGRPVADIMRSVPLPDQGMTLTVPRGTTGTRVMQQTSQNSAVQETDYDETDLSVPIVTLSGQQDVSRQAIMRGAGVDGIVMADLIADYHREQDSQVISGTGASGTHFGLLATTGRTTITVNSTSAIAQWKQLAQAVAGVHENRKAPASHILMSPRRWGYWSSATDSNGRPLVLPSAQVPQNAMGVMTGLGSGIVGTAHGLPVVVDANIPTTTSSTTASTQEDVIVVVRANDHIIAESTGGPMGLRFEETLAGSLTVKLVVFDFSAFTAGRYPTSVAVLTGTGLTTPVFA